MLVREGLGRLDGVLSASDHPSVETSTCQVQVRPGLWLSPDFLSQEFDRMRIGARLRGMEGVFVGTIEQQGSDYVLALAGLDRNLLLRPLKVKVQLDHRSGLPAAVDLEEALAWEKLTSRWKGDPFLAQVTGPVLENSESGLIELQVREFQSSADPSEVRELTLRIETSGPYGLGEPWPLIREGLETVPGIRALDPEFTESLCKAALIPGTVPDLDKLERVIRETGTGAVLVEVEAEVQGWLARSGEKIGFKLEPKGESPRNEPISALRPNPPRNVKAEFQNGWFHLHWEEMDDPDLNSFDVHRSTTSGSGYIQVAAGIMRSPYSFYILGGESDYYFVVTARNQAGNPSTFSNEAHLRLGTSLAD